MSNSGVLFDLNIKSELADFLFDIKTNYNAQINEDYDIPIYKSSPKSLINSKKKVLILCGGGIRGISHVGVIKSLIEKKCFHYIDTMVGTSIGAIVIFFIVIGYNPDEIMEIIRNIDIDKMKSIKITSFLSSYGFDNGSKMDFILERVLKAKKYNEDITFAELYSLTKKHIIFTTVCLNTNEVVYLSHETTPLMPVRTGVRMSSCLPIIFSPILYESKYYIDGGCIDNYPIHLFKDRLDDCIGVYLKNNSNEKTEINNIKSYLMQVMKSLFHGSSYKDTKGYEKYTIFITDKTSTFDFEISKEKREELYNLGYNTVNKL
jgi:NTE family protein